VTNPTYFDGIPPISFAVASRQRELGQWEALARGDADGFFYSRNTPTDAVEMVERQLAQLEGAECALSFSSGMGAISSVLTALLAPSKRVVVGRDTYGGTTHLFTHTLPKWGVEVSMVDTTNEAAFLTAIESGCDLLYLETPSNPLVKIQDITKLASWAHDANAIVVIDNTVATPVNQTPLALGADIVIHSATKFLGGHADALGGVVATSLSLRRTLKDHRDVHGACLDPMSAYLIVRGMRTLELRMERHNHNALRLAKYLQDHPKVARVYFPGLATHPGHDLAVSQMSGFGALLSFELVGGERTVGETLSQFKRLSLASTLGSVDTLLGTPSTTSHVECTVEERRALGIPAGLIRCSVGIEPIGCIIEDFEQAL